ncbi:ISAs1 family transposase [Gemmata sp.]|uniref:ISAs1 family transposase n=1 Tax=Gemmata sp. TaxID=1914242 RepID=UPI003F6FC638
MPNPDVSIARHFAGLPDPRIDRTRKHALGDILAIDLSAVISGADSWEKVEAFGEAKGDRLKRFLSLPNGIPSHDTCGRVFARLDPQAFGRCVAGWMAELCKAAGLRHIAVDGSVVRSASTVELNTSTVPVCVEIPLPDPAE